MDELLPWSPGLGELTPIINSAHRITPGRRSALNQTRAAGSSATQMVASSDISRSLGQTSRSNPERGLLSPNDVLQPSQSDALAFSPTTHRLLSMMSPHLSSAVKQADAGNKQLGTNRNMPPPTPQDRRSAGAHAETMAPCTDDALQRIISPAGQRNDASHDDKVTLRTLAGGIAGMLSPSFSVERPEMDYIATDVDFQLNDDDVNDVENCFEFSENFSPQKLPHGSPESKRVRKRGTSVENSPNCIDPASLVLGSKTAVSQEAFT